MVNISTQRGASAIGWLIIIVVGGLIAMMGLKLLPIYMEHYSVTSSLNSLADERDGGTTAYEIRERLQKRLRINNVQDVDQDNIEVRELEDAFLVTVQYQVREPFIANVDFLVSFSDTVRVPAP